MEANFKDIFSLAMQKDKAYPQFTTFKYRKAENWVKRTIDYIFMAQNEYTNKNKVTVSKYMDPAQIEKDGNLNTEIGYPAPDWPSDHFSIAYEVYL
jgi:hypothetical protein